MNFAFFRFEKRNEFILKVAGNKIRLAARLGVPLAENWITDENGKVIEEELENVPNKFYMAPMGGTRENSSHKGILICSSNFCTLPLVTIQVLRHQRGGWVGSENGTTVL